MKTLLQINSVVNFRSTGIIVEEIGKLAILNGWKSYVAYGLVARPSKSDLLKIGNKWDILLHVIKTRFFDQHGFGSYKATMVLINNIKVINPDIIHLHNIHNYYINIRVLFHYLKAANIPVVWTFHDLWPITGHCAHFSSIGCEKWKTGCYLCPQKLQYPASYFLDRSRANFNNKKDLFNSVEKMIIVPVSDWVSETLKYSHLSKKKKQVIKNGVDLNLFSPQKRLDKIEEKYQIGNRFMLIGVATSWSDRKGLYDFLKLEKFLTQDYVIVLVGLSKSQIKKLPKTMIGIARTENINELAALYNRADIILNLSAEETFGLTTIEGFACGTPGIVYNCTASPELITPETGYVVEKGDMKGLIHAIQTIKAKGKCSYSTACRVRAEKLYDNKDRYFDYIKLYESILTVNDVQK